MHRGRCFAGVIFVPRVISFIVLLAVLLFVGAIFFQVMAQFFVPLFIACVLLVVFKPLHSRILRRMPRHPRLAALTTTISILLAVLLPLVWLGWKAYADFYALLNQPTTGASAAIEKDATKKPPPPAETSEQPLKSLSTQQEQAEQNELTVKLKTFAKDLVSRATEPLHLEVNDDTVEKLIGWAAGFATKIAISSVQSAIGILIGLFILVFALYYFLADGPAMIETVMNLSPLDNEYEQELLQRFSEVSRAVVLAMLLSAIVQGALAGIGYIIALPAGSPIFLLIALTMVAAIIPFFGAAAAWVFVCGWLYVHGAPVKAIVLAIYCTIVVSGVDNIIKPLILHGQSKLHPLLAFLSILGGIQVFGPVGLLVGPMLVSFLQALLNMLRKELDSFSRSGNDSSKPLAESVVEAIQMVAENAADSKDDAEAAPADGNTNKALKASPAVSNRPKSPRSKHKHKR
jgi:predicted PurR-regulated permease PerM